MMFCKFHWDGHRGFAAPINPRPVLLVLLAADTIVWRSGATMADVRDWQPHIPGDPTFSALEHVLTSSETLPAATCTGDQATSLQLGIFMPDARMEKLVETNAMGAAFSVRLANSDVGWQTVKGEGAVNILANVTCA